MRRRAFAIAALAATLVGTTAAAGPLIFEETAKIGSPDPAYTGFPLGLAVEGDTIIAIGLKREFTLEPYEHTRSDYAAFLFRRQSNGSWTYVRTLAQTSCDEGERGEDTCPVTAAIRNGVAAVSAGQVHIFRRASNGDWIAEPSNAFVGPGDVAPGNGVVLTSHPVCEGLGVNAFRPNQSGVWTEIFTITSSTGCDHWGLTGNDVDISAGNRWIASDPNYPATSAHIFEPAATTWTQTATLTSPLSSEIFGFSVAMDDTRAFASGPSEAPIHVFNRAGGTWMHSVNIVPPDSAVRANAGHLKVRDLLFAAFANDPHRRGSVGVFRINSSGQYEEVAKLVSSTLQQNRSFGVYMDAWVDGSSVRVAAGGPDGVHVFDLNQLGTTLAPAQEDFELGSSSNWTPLAGSSFSVVASGGSKVYRQSNTTGDAGAFVTNISRTNQAIEADVKPTAFNGADRWVGLVVRRTDASNYYYVTLRQSNVLQLKRMVNGAFVTLASTPVSVALNRNYRLRLEAVGTRLRAYVDGRLAVETTDTALKQGHAGVQMYRASADLDNVVLSPDPHLTLLDHRTPYVITDRWNFTLGSWGTAHLTSDRLRFVQQDTAGDARAITRVASNDQIVQVAATATSFAAGSGSRWFGVVARYVDAGNFYYVTVRHDNTISLRKLVNGAIQILDTAPLTVSAGATYALRLEAIGTSLRAYVNGNVVLEANDSSYASGKYGLATYRTAATFDDFLAWEP
jgi:hypothetical protein